MRPRRSIRKREQEIAIGKRGKRRRHALRNDAHGSEMRRTRFTIGREASHDDVPLAFALRALGPRNRATTTPLRHGRGADGRAFACESNERSRRSKRSIGDAKPLCRRSTNRNNSAAIIATRCTHDLRREHVRPVRRDKSVRSIR
jgi:hypothetical protein